MELASNKSEFGLYFQSEGRQMVTCQNCGNTNGYGTNFCRFCGMSIAGTQSAPDYSAPQEPQRPYMWKTDELPAARNPVRKTEEIKQVQPLFTEAPTAAFKPSQFAQMAPPQAAPVAPYGFRCPRCGSQQMPVVGRQISTAGWVVFAALLVFTVVFFWIGLLIKEDVRICPVCNYKFN